MRPLILWRTSARSPLSLSMFVRFFLVAAILEPLVLGAYLRNHFMHGRAARRSLQPVGPGALAIGLQLCNHALLLPHRLAEARDECLVVAHAGDSHAGGCPPPEHVAILLEVALELAAAALRIRQAPLHTRHLHGAFTLVLFRQNAYRLQSFGSLHLGSHFGLGASAASAMVDASWAVLAPRLTRSRMSWRR